MDIKLEIRQQQKPKNAFAQLPDLPDNPFFKRVDRDEGGHVYEAKQRCWYWLWTIVGPMDGGDYLPTVVRSSRFRRPNTRRTPGRVRMMAGGGFAAITCTIGTAGKSWKASASTSAGGSRTPILF